MAKVKGFVIIDIARFNDVCKKHDKKGDLGAFMRKVTFMLLTEKPDKSEAGKFARELLGAR